jgi:protease-4
MAARGQVAAQHQGEERNGDGKDGVMGREYRNAGPVVEQRTGSARDSALKQLQGEDNDQTRLRDVLAVLDAAAKDENITHALLMLDGFGGAGLPTLREIGAAIERFKADGQARLRLGFGL